MKDHTTTNHHSKKSRKTDRRYNLMKSLLNKMNSYEYGYTSHISPFERITTNVRNPFVMYKKWALASPEEVETNKIGICFDLCELERDFCNKHDIPCKTFFVLMKYVPNVHTVLMFQDDSQQWNVFEYAFHDFAGIHGPFEDYLSGGLSILDDWIGQMGAFKAYNVYEYDQPEYGLSLIDFFKHCTKHKIYST